MRMSTTGRQSLSLLHTSSHKTIKKSCPCPLRKHGRKCTCQKCLSALIPADYDMHMHQDSQVSEGTSSYTHHPPPHSPNRAPANSINADTTDAIEFLRKIFPPLEFPKDVAQRMATHVSWERGVHGHNGRLGFVGRRVLHTYLLLFLHECTLAPPSHNPPKNAPIPPSSRLRPSSLHAGGFVKPVTESYDDISEKLLNTYTLGEHVGAAWELERIMRWTPAIVEFDALKSESPDSVLRSSGLYKVRGAIVEGVVGGVFHQFGGSVAHRVFHTRVLPHVYKLGLPVSLHSKMREACQRLGGEHGNLTKPNAAKQTSPVGVALGPQERRPTTALEDDRPRSIDSSEHDTEFMKVGRQQRAREMQRLGFRG